MLFASKPKSQVILILVQEKINLICNGYPHHFLISDSTFLKIVISCWFSSKTFTIRTISSVLGREFYFSIFSGRTSFKNGETTTASVGRICTERSVGISVDVNPFEPHILASNMAHAIGHNLGFGHDDTSSPSTLGEN